VDAIEKETVGQNGKEIMRKKDTRVQRVGQTHRHGQKYRKHTLSPITSRNSNEFTLSAGQLDHNSKLERSCDPATSCRRR
jgi:hypothetical protein